MADFGVTVCAPAVVSRFNTRAFKLVSILIAVCLGTTLLFNSPRADRADRVYDHELTVCTLVLNEERYMPEWLEFHLAQGAEGSCGHQLQDSRQPGVWWGGVCFLALYERHAASPLEDLGFLERTARCSVTWELQPHRPQTSRMRLDVSLAGKVVRSRTLSCCAACNAFLDSPKRCGACDRVVYCGKACQRADWPTHKALCRSLTASV
jgi:MYND finger